MTDIQDESTALIAVETLNPIEVFSTKGGLDPIIEKIKERVEAQDFDITTDQGRKNIGSYARKIGSSKKKLESMALELTQGWRDKVDAVNVEKKRMISEFDALRDKIKKPLDEYNAEQDRLKAVEQEALDKLAAVRSYIEREPSNANRTAEAIKTALNLSGELYEGFKWSEDFIDKAKVQHDKNIDALTVALASQEQYEKDHAELAELREAKAKKEAAEKKAEAEKAEKARAEQERKDGHEAVIAQMLSLSTAENVSITHSVQAGEWLDKLSRVFSRDWDEYRERASKVYEQIKSELEGKKLSLEKAEADFRDQVAKEQAEKAVAAERERVAKEKIKAEEIEAKRAADLENRVNIEVQVIDDIMMRLGLNSVESRNVISQAVEAIGSGDIPNIKITY